MLDATRLDAMTPEERGDMFFSMAVEWYGTTRFKTMISKDLSVTRPTVYNWMNDGASIPYAVLMVLDAWLERRRLSDQLTEIAGALSPDAAA